MKVYCPYCQGELKEDVVLPRMSARQLRIYKAIVAAGVDGIDSNDLLVRMYDEEEWPTPGGRTVLRVMIHEINKRIANHDQQILNWHRKRYKLVSTKEEVQQQANS